MWPKNLAIYRFNREIEIVSDKLEQQLAEFAFKPCGPTDVAKMGWVKVLGSSGDMYSHEVAGDIVLKVCSEKKRIPPKLLKARVNERVAERELEKGSPLKAAERRDIKEAVILELLPGIFPEPVFCNIYIMRSLSLILVDTAGWKGAEDNLSLLRKSIGSLPVVPVVPLEAIETTLSGWVKTSELPAGYEMNGSVELTSVLDGQSVLRGVKQDMTCERLISHLEEAQVTKLGLDWNDRLSFVLTADGLVKSIKWSEDTRHQNDDIPKEDVAARMDSDFALLFGELGAFVPNLYEVLGGYLEPGSD